MMYPWLDYKGLAYYSKKLRDKLRSAFSDIYDDITDITDAEIEELFEEDESETSDENSITQNSVEDDGDSILQEDEIVGQDSDENIVDKESNADLANSSLDNSSNVDQQSPLTEENEDDSSPE